MIERQGKYIIQGVLLFYLAGICFPVAKAEDTALILQPVQTKVYSESVSDQHSQYVDFVLVRKSERKLYLYSGDSAIKTYPIALGRQPEGQKIREGDSRTPEGLYTLDWRNPTSKFFRSIHVSYPNISQERNAKEAGVDPGGAIMIHGQPNDWAERIQLTFKHKDWTEGCIAVENQDMLEIWDLVRDGTPIKIEP